MVSKHYGESWCHEHLADQGLIQLLEKVDTDLVREARLKGCLLCGGKLHRSDYERKPRGGPQWDVRFSLCCAREGCRRRLTPASVRFMGRRVYAGLVVVLVSAMLHGLKPERVQCLREALGIDRRTLERWRQWWLGIFLESSFWREARARFMPPLCHKSMPLSLCVSGATGCWTCSNSWLRSPRQRPGKSWLCEAPSNSRRGCRTTPASRLV